ncbi:DNA polymerase I [Geodia barretti]|uniref:DNA polymerase I n=1 Tax=Geodia barretti TaxID=519541 RepID=A0AA35RBE5_GEOBA|nr:DNA polymerase I [Geodia barretti]
MLKSLEASRIVAFDTETTSQTAMLAELVGLSFSNEEGKGWYVPVGMKMAATYRDYVLERLRPLLESGKAGLAADDKRYALAAHNANYDMTVLANYGINVDGLRSTR